MSFHKSGRSVHAHSTCEVRYRPGHCRSSVGGQKNRRVCHVRQRGESVKEGHALDEASELISIHREIGLRPKRIVDAVRPETNDANALRAELGRQSAGKPLYCGTGDAKSAS